MIGYSAFLIFKKHAYKWSIGSIYNIAIEAAEFILLIYIYRATATSMVMIFYISFILRLNIIYDKKIFWPAAIAVAITGLVMDWSIRGFALNTDCLFRIIYWAILYGALLGGISALSQVLSHWEHKEGNYRNLITIKDSLIDELDQSREQLREYNEELYHIASTDELTRLYNGQYFHEFMDNMFDYIGEYQDPICLIMVHVERFFNYCNTYGGTKGEELLQDIAQILKECAGDDDVLVRYNNEMFAAILPGQYKEESNQFCENLLELWEQYQNNNPITRNIEIFIGQASNAFGVRTKEELIRNAEPIRRLEHNKPLKSM